MSHSTKNWAVNSICGTEIRMRAARVRIVSRSVRVTYAAFRALGDRPRMVSVIEDIVAAVVGLALVIYLAYALARPERF